MRTAAPYARILALLNKATSNQKRDSKNRSLRETKNFRTATTALSLALCWMLIQPGIMLASPNVQGKAVSTSSSIQKQAPVTSIQKPAPVTKGKTPPVSVLPPVSLPPAGHGGAIYNPTYQPVASFPPVNVRAIARQAALEPSTDVPSEIKAIHAPKGDRPIHNGVVPIITSNNETSAGDEVADSAPPPSATGASPGPIKSFKGEFLSSTSIPPDTMGAVGLNHVVTVSNDRMRIQTRNGVELSRVTLTSFWAGTTIKGATVSAFDPKVLYDRFNDRFILISTFNAQSISSGAGFAVSQTGDPTGVWNRYTVEADPTSTTTGGRWIDYPSIGFNKNWIVVNYNTFGYGSVTGYQRADIFVLDKQAAYNGTLSTISAFQGLFADCVASSTQETELGCGFTMAPTITEDNTTDTVYLVEDWDSTAGQLRMSKITGTPSAPMLTVATQFPQSAQSWRFDAARIGTTGGYAPQRQQSAYLVSGTRIMTNDSRIQNAVLRNGKLWTTHGVMLSQAPTPAGVAVGGTANPDTHSAIQWWQIDPTQETGTSNPASVLQRGRIEDPTADNCHNGSAGTRTDPTCNSTALQKGQFYAYPNISVNKNEDVLIGFTQFSALTYPNSAYAIRRSADPVNTTRDPAVYRPGQANYNLGAGTGGTTARQNRWGDYSAAQTDPLDDTTFWTVQEYAGTVRDFGIGLAGNWETWWAQINPAATAPTTSGNLIINEFRLRGPQGVNDEFVEVFNPGASSVIVNTTDNSDGWALAYSANGTTVTGVTVIPNGTVIAPKSHFLIARNPDASNGPTVTYSLNGYPGATNPATLVRGADSDTGYSIDLSDNGGLALFRTSTPANFSTTTRMDSVGFSTIAAGLFKEGNGIPAMTTQPTTNFSYYRDLCGKGGSQTQLGGCPTLGQPKDSNDNATDFVFVDINGTSPTAGIQRLGAPGPENLSSPIERNSTIGGTLVDATKGQSAPNRVRDLTPGSASTSTFGTLTLRKRIVNNTGGPVTRLRFRVIDMTTFPAASGFADLRAISSTAVVVSGINDAATCQAANGVPTTPCSVTVQGTTLEEPPTQINGGGFDTTLSVGTVTFLTPLASGASVNVQFVLGVQQTGTFKFNVNVEALP